MTEELRLFFNTSKEDREAFLLLKSSDIPCEFFAPAGDDPYLEESPSKPILKVGYSRYIGIKEIKNYLNRPLKITTGS